MILNNDFLQILSLVLISMICSSISPVLFFRKNIMFVNIISHSSLITITISQVILRYFNMHPFSIMLIVSILLCYGLMFIQNSIVNKTIISNQEINVLLMPLTFAVGAFLVSLFYPGSSMGSEMFFGSLESISLQDIKQLMYIACLCVTTTYILRRYYVLYSIDPDFAKLSNKNINLIKNIIMWQATIAIIFVCYITGIVIALSFFSGMLLIARIFSKSPYDMFTHSFMISFCISVVSIVICRLIYFWFNIAFSISGMIPIIIGIALIMSHSIQRIK